MGSKKPRSGFTLIVKGLIGIKADIMAEHLRIFCALKIGPVNLDY